MSYYKTVRPFIGTSFSMPMCVETDGTNDNINYGTLGNILSASEGTITMWIKVLSRSANSGARIFGDSGGYIYMYQVNGSADGYIFDLFTGTDRRSATFNLALNTWTRLALCYKSDSSAINVYKDGVSVGTNQTMTANISDVTNSFRMGGNGVSATLYTNNRFHLWETWNVKFSAAQALEDYNGGRYRNPALHSAVANLVHSWRPGNTPDTGTTVNDRTGARNGTLTNGAFFTTDSPPS